MNKHMQDMKLCLPNSVPTLTLDQFVDFFLLMPPNWENCILANEDKENPMMYYFVEK